MVAFVSVGDKLFHKYLGVITVINVSESGLKADTGSRGVLEFAFYDFGKVLYLNKDHSLNSYRTYKEYMEFIEKEKKMKLEMKAIIKKERKQKRLRQKEEEIKKETIHYQDYYLLDLNYSSKQDTQIS